MLIHELTHLFLCVLVAVIGFYYRRSLWVWIASFAAGFLVDVDHLIDYFVYRRSFSLYMAEFISGKYFDVSGKIYLFLHSYEAAILCLCLAIVYSLTKKTSRISKTIVLLIVIGFSLILHLLYDTVYYKPDWGTYFIVNRISNGFDIDNYHFN